MTNRIDRLEQAGLVQRRPDPSDRRGVLVRLSGSGRRRVDACLSALVLGERELLSALVLGEQDELASLLCRLLVQLENKERFQ